MGQEQGIDYKGKVVEVSGSSMVENHNGGDIVLSMTSPLEDLPVDCISKIISFTSPRDACVLSSVSKTFESAVNLESVWEKFLPSDYESLRSASQASSLKKDLYFALCAYPVLIDDGKMSFWLEKASGKKCVMLAPREQQISWETIPSFWEWISIPDLRFKEVAEIVHGCPFRYNGEMQTRYLSPETRYSGYIVFKTKNLEQVDVGEESFQRLISFVRSTDPMREIKTIDVKKPEKREDGWMETKLCEFFNEACCDEHIQLSLLEIKSPYWKPGLIIQGIEFRPSKNM